MPARQTERQALAGALLGLAAAVLQSDAAQACSRPAPLEFRLDLDAVAVDRSPPAPPAGVSARVTRTSGTYCDSDGLCIVSSCGSTGSLQLQFTPPADEATPAQQLGYRVRWLDGSLPASLAAPLERIAVGASPLTIELPFDAIPELDATFELIAIDRAGNESDASEPFHAAFDGCTHSVGLGGCAEDTGGRVVCADGTCFESAATGCAFRPGRSAPAAGLALVLAGALCVLRRRRLRRS
jgi:hypothetical protein